MSAAEATIERNVCKFAKAAGLLVYKFVSPGQRGVPDRIFISAEGQTVYVEFKAPKGRVSPLQQMHINQLRGHKAEVRVIRTVDEGKQLVCDIKSGALFV